MEPSGSTRMRRTSALHRCAGRRNRNTGRKDTGAAEPFGKAKGRPDEQYWDAECGQTAETDLWGRVRTFRGEPGGRVHTDYRQNSAGILTGT